LARLFDRVGELDRPYMELSREERTAVLARELGSRRPLVGSAITEDASILDDATRTTFNVFREIRDAPRVYGPSVIQTALISMTPRSSATPPAPPSPCSGRSAPRIASTAPRSSRPTSSR